MGLLGRFIVFIICILVGLVFLMKTDNIIKWTGRISFAEKYFGAAGTYAFLRVLGGLIMFGGLVFLTNTHAVLLDSIFGGLAPIV